MKFDWKTAFKIGLSVVLVYIVIHYWSRATGFVEMLISSAIPLVVGAILAYFVNILMGFYERHWFKNSKKKWIQKTRRPICMLGAFITFIAVIAVIAVMVVPLLISCANLIIEKTPQTFEFLTVKARQYNLISEDFIESFNNIDWGSVTNNLLVIFGPGFGNFVDTAVMVVTSVFSAVINSIVSVIFAVYLLFSKDKIKIQIRMVMDRYLKPSLNIKAKYVLKTLNSCFRGYIVGQCTEAVILGGLCTIGMMIFGFPYAAMVGALMAVTALIPVAGAYIGGAIGAFMMLTVSPVKSILFIVFIVVLQQLEGNLIFPKVVGTKLGLPGLWVIVAVTIGGGVMGIAGMFFGVPIAAAIYRIMRDDLRKKIPGKNYNKLAKAENAG